MFQPHYTISNKLLNTVAQIEAYRVRTDTSAILPEREIEMRHRSTVDATHDSTSIEGNPLTRKQVEAVLSGERLTRHRYAQREVSNYRAALDYIEKRRGAGLPLQVADLLELHRLTMLDLLPAEKTGQYRSGEIFVVDHGDRVAYTGTAPHEVAEKVDELIEWLAERSENLNPVIASGILHYQLVSIHPFANGNGRTTRLATACYLGLRDYDFRASIVLDSYYAANRREYYAALQQGHGTRYAEGRDLTEWLNYFAVGFLSSAKVLWTEVSLLSEAAGRLNDARRPVRRLTAEQTDLLSYVQRFGDISVSEAQSILPQLSRRSVQRVLAGLVQDGLLATEGAGRSVRYAPPKK
jgi:Fic family protein